MNRPNSNVLDLAGGSSRRSLNWVNIELDNRAEAEQMRAERERRLG